ncbi:MAG: hypothetical protein FJ280_05960 [Planctomycetes bacterium]|nr:hypothetical protein [Planctomycetota bacterium]
MKRTVALTLLVVAVLLGAASCRRQRPVTQEPRAEAPPPRQQPSDTADTQPPTTAGGQPPAGGTAQQPGAGTAQ